MGFARITCGRGKPDKRGRSRGFKMMMKTVKSVLKDEKEVIVKELNIIDEYGTSDSNWPPWATTNFPEPCFYEVSW